MRFWIIMSCDFVRIELIIQMLIRAWNYFFTRKERTSSTFSRVSRGVQTSFNPGRRPSNEVGLVVDFLTSGKKQVSM